MTGNTIFKVLVRAAKARNSGLIILCQTYIGTLGGEPSTPDFLDKVLIGLRLGSVVSENA